MGAAVFFIVVIGGTALMLVVRHAAAKQVGLPATTPFKLSAAVSSANKGGQDALSVTMSQGDVRRAVGPMSKIGWESDAMTFNRSRASGGKKTTIVFHRVPAK